MGTSSSERNITQVLGLPLASLPKAPDDANARDRAHEKPACVRCGQPGLIVYLIEDDEHPQYGRRWLDLCPRHNYELCRQTDVLDLPLFKDAE